jgi:two-component system OmpR family sensor kinase
MKSIRRQLLLSFLTILMVLTAIMIGVVYADTTQELQELLIGNMRRMAIVIQGQGFSPAPTQNNPIDMDTGELEESYVIQIWDDKGALLRSSRPDVALPLQAQEGLNQVKQGKRFWEIYSLKAGGSGYVQIAQPREIIATMIGESALQALAPLIAFFVVLAVSGWFVVGRGLSPLNRLSQSIKAWNVDNFQPLEMTDTPHEIQPIVNALNTMLSKLNKALSIQRQFTADAAHELRTPLTAIKLQLDNLIQARTAQEQQEATKRLSEGIDRSIHVANQLLAASRNTAVKTAPDFRPVRLDEIVRVSIVSFVAAASAKQIELGYENNVECSILGDAEGLRVMVNNLLDNAIRYTPSQGKVTVHLSKEVGWTIFKISDTGPGIPESERNKVFQRFYRIPGTPSTGSGLGLSIVKSVAENHNGNVAVVNSPSGQGTTIRIFFRDSGINIDCP